MIFCRVEGGYCSPAVHLPRLRADSPSRRGGGGGGSTDDREGPAEGREDPGPGGPGCTGTPAPGVEAELAEIQVFL